MYETRGLTHSLFRKTTFFEKFELLEVREIGEERWARGFAWYKNKYDDDGLFPGLWKGVWTRTDWRYTEEIVD